jgi:hypothetical protein
VRLEDPRQDRLDEGYRHHGMQFCEVGYQAINPVARNRRVSDERVKKLSVDLSGHAAASVIPRTPFGRGVTCWTPRPASEHLWTMTVLADPTSIDDIAGSRHLSLPRLCYIPRQSWALSGTHQKMTGGTGW